MAVDDTLLRIRAVSDANQLVIDHEAFGDPDLIERLADLIERTRFKDEPAYALIVVAELRARAAVVAALKGNEL